MKFGLVYPKNRFSHRKEAFILELRPSCIKKLANNQKYGEFWGEISIPLQLNDPYIFSWDDAHLYWLKANNLAIVTKKRSLKNLMLRLEWKFDLLAGFPIPQPGAITNRMLSKI